MNPNEVGEAPKTAHDPVIMAEDLRTRLKDIELMVRQFADVVKGPNCIPLFDKGEVIANAMLTLRHVEDARMRLGKCIQYSHVENGGESCYKK